MQPGKRYERIHAKVKRLDPGALRALLEDREEPYWKTLQPTDPRAKNPDPIAATLAGLRIARKNWALGDMPSYSETAVTVGRLAEAFIWAEHSYGQLFWECVNECLTKQEKAEETMKENDADHDQP